MSEKGLLELFQTEDGTYLDERLRLGIRRVLDLQFKGIRPGFQLTCCKCMYQKITNDCDPVFLSALMDTTFSPPIAMARLWYNTSFVCKDCSPDRPSSNEDGIAAPKPLEVAKAACSTFSGPLSSSLPGALRDAGGCATANVTARVPAATAVKAAKPPLALSKPRRASFPGLAPSAALGLRSGSAADEVNAGDIALVNVAQRPAPSGKPAQEGSSFSSPISGRQRAAQDAGGSGGADGVVDVVSGGTAAEVTDGGFGTAGEMAADVGPGNTTPCAVRQGSMDLLEYFEVRSSPMKGIMLSNAIVKVTYTRNYLFGCRPDRSNQDGDDVDPASEEPGVLHLLSSQGEAAEVAERYAEQLPFTDVQRLRALDFSVSKPALQTLSHTLLAIADWVLMPQALQFADTSGAADVASTKSGSAEAAVSAHAIAAQLRSWAFTVRKNKDVQQHGTCLRPSLQCLGGRALGKPPTSLLEVLNAPPLAFCLAREALVRQDRPQVSLASRRANFLSPDRGAGLRLRPGWVLPLQRLAALLKKRNRRPYGPWKISAWQLSVRLKELLQGDAIYGSEEEDYTIHQLQQKGAGTGASHAGSHAAAGFDAASKLGQVDRFLQDLGATRQQVLEVLQLADVDENVGFCVECGFVGSLVACDSCVDSFCANCLGQDPEDLADEWRCRFCQIVFQSEDTRELGAQEKAGPLPKSAAGIMHKHVKQEPAAIDSHSETVDTIGTTTGSQEADEEEVEEDEEDEVVEIQESPDAGAAGTSGAAVHGSERPHRDGVEQQEGHVEGSVADPGQLHKDAWVMPAARRVGGLQGVVLAASSSGRGLGAEKEAAELHGLEKHRVGMMETAAGVAGPKGQVNSSTFHRGSAKRTRALLNESNDDDILLVEPGKQPNKRYRSSNIIVVSEDEDMDKAGSAGKHGVAGQGADDTANDKPSTRSHHIPRDLRWRVDDDLLKKVAAAAVAVAAELGQAAHVGAEIEDENFRFAASQPQLGSAEPGHDGMTMHAMAAGTRAARPSGRETIPAGVDTVVSGDVNEAQGSGSGDGEESGSDSGTEAAPAAGARRKPSLGQAAGWKRRDMDYEPSNEGGDEDEEDEQGEGEASSEPELRKAKKQRQQRQRREAKTGHTSRAVAGRTAADPHGRESSEGTGAAEDAASGSDNADDDSEDVELVAEGLAPQARRSRGRGRVNRGRGKKATRKHGQVARRRPVGGGGSHVMRGVAGVEARDDGSKEWVPPSGTMLAKKSRGGRPPRSFARPVNFPPDDGLGTPAVSGLMDDRDAAAALMMLNTNSAAAGAGAGAAGTAQHGGQLGQPAAKTAAANAAGAATLMPAPGVPQPATAVAVHRDLQQLPLPLPGSAAPSGFAKPGDTGATQAQALNPPLAAGSNRSDGALRSPGSGPSLAPQGAAHISVVGTRTAAVAEPKQQDSRPRGWQQEQRHTKKLGIEQENQQQPPTQQRHQYAAGADANAGAGPVQFPTSGSLQQHTGTGVAVPQDTATPLHVGLGEVKSELRASGPAASTGANPNTGLFLAKHPMTKKEATKAGCKLFEYAAERGVDAGLLAQWTATLARALEWYETDLELQGTLKSCLNGLVLSSTAALDLSDLERMIRSITKMLDDSTQETAATTATRAAVGPGT